MLISILILVLIFLIALTIFGLLMLISIIVGVPFIPVKNNQTQKMIALANLKLGMTVIDLGSGAGQFLFKSAKLGANAIGYELNPILCIWTRILIFLRGLRNKVKINCQSIYKANLSNVDIVFTYLMPGPMEKLADKLFSELKPGAKIISFAFAIPDCTPLKQEGRIFVYLIP
jgi:cyclopropane fatty-acyl-phospholipid synthase-like methyltransferase